MNETSVGTGTAWSLDPIADPAAPRRASWKRNALFGAIAGIFAAPITVTLLLGFAEMARGSRMIPIPHSPWSEIARALILGLIPGYGLSQQTGTSHASALQVVLSTVTNGCAYAALLVALGWSGAAKRRVWSVAAVLYAASAGLAAFTLLRG